MRRLLLAGGGSGSFVIPTPIDEQGRWVRWNGSTPLFTDPSAALSAAHEPTVMIESGTWKLWYTGGPFTGTCGVDYATSSDGLTWSRYMGNPVIGVGSGGISADVVEPCVFKFGSTYWCYCGTKDGDKHVLTSSDGTTWTEQTLTLADPPGMPHGWGNTFVWKEGSTYYALMDAGGYGGTTYWRSFLYTSSDLLTWTIANGGADLGSLQITAGGMYGNCRLVRGGAKINGKYHMYYHAAPAGFSDAHGNLPTDIYHAWSTDKVNWTVVTPNPILEHLGGSTFEFDQVADAWVIEDGAGSSYMYYSGENNPSGHAAIGLAIAPVTLEDIIAGTA